MAQETALYRDDVEQVRRRWAEWRSTHAVRSRLPEELWAAAVELVQRDGMDATARTLDVDKPSLRKWAGRLQPAASQPSRRKPFNSSRSFAPRGDSTSTRQLVAVLEPEASNSTNAGKAFALCLGWGFARLRPHRHAADHAADGEGLAPVGVR
jgi:hypothetical protein